MDLKILCCRNFSVHAGFRRDKPMGSLLRVYSRVYSKVHFVTKIKENEKRLVHLRGQMYIFSRPIKVSLLQGVNHEKY
jgi:hypothetical protein